MRKLLSILLLLTCLLPSAKGQDSITFMPVFYIQCNNNLIKADSVNFRLSYNDYSYLIPDTNDDTYNKTIGVFYAAKTEAQIYEVVPEKIRLPKTAENIGLFTDTYAELEMQPDENNIWRDTFYIENSERFFRPSYAIQSECGEISHGIITRYSLTGEISEVAQYDEGVLINKTQYHEGIKVYEGKNLNTFDSGYLLIRYNKLGDTIFYQDHQYSALYSYDGKLMAELFYPQQTKKQIKRYKKNVSKSVYNSIIYIGKPLDTKNIYRPCMGIVYFPSGKIKLEGEYLVPITKLKDDVTPFVELIALDVSKSWWFNAITLWVKEYDETGRFIYRDISPKN